MMFKSQKRKSIGEMIIGFALLFLGLTYLKNSVPDLSANPEVLAFIQRWTDWGFFSILIFVLVGTVLTITIILQSSSATVALTLVMASQGWIPFEIAAAMVLGENIGTTITANIAASVGNISAKRAALAHTVFNVFGVIWVLALYKPFLWLVAKIVVGLGGEDPFTSSASLLYAISTVHTLFNITNTCILIWFTPQIVKLVTWIIKGRRDEEEVFRLRYIQGGMMSTAELSLEQAEQEVVHFSEIVKRQYAYARQAVNEADRIEFEIAKYLSNIGEGELSQDGTNRMHAMYKIISELESIGDSGFNIGRILQRKNLHGQKFDEGAVKKINHMLDLVDTALDCMTANLRSGFQRIINISNAQDAEHDINEYRDNLKEEHLRHIEAEESGYLRGVYYMDLISECERVGDFAIKTCQRPWSRPTSMGMRQVLSLLSAAVLMLLAVSCADDAAVMSELDAAESVMEDSPETALALLDTMQRSRLVSRKAAARHALLYSQTRKEPWSAMSVRNGMWIGRRIIGLSGGCIRRKRRYILICIILTWHIDIHCCQRNIMAGQEVQNCVSRPC